MAASNLKEKTLKGLFWSSIEIGGKQFLRFFIGLLLARLLTPEDYGLVGMITIFINLAMTIVESGFSMALLQKKDANQTDYSTVFIFNVIAGFFFYLLLYFTAPFIARFYNEARLILIIRIVSLNFVVSSFGIVQATLFSKSLNFKIIAKVNLLAVLISGSLGITMAFLGYKFWALVIQSLTMSLVTTLVFWTYSKWKPSILFNFQSFKKLFKFGSNLMISGIINTFFNDAYLLVIGKFYSASQLGLYSKANGLANMPVKGIYGIFSKVFFPAFSLIQDDNVRLKKNMQKVLITASYVIFPIMFGIIAAARPFILLTLTEKWEAVIPYLQLLCLSSMFIPLHAINLNVMNIKGRSDLFLKLEIIKKAMIFIALLVTFRHGIIALILGQLASNFIALFLNTMFMKKLVDYSTLEQFRDLLPNFILSLLMAAIIYIPLIYIEESPYALQLIIQIIIGSCFYFFASKILEFKGFLEIRSNLKENLNGVFKGKN